MKKRVMVIVSLSALITIYSCKGKKAQNEQSDSTTSSATTEVQAAPAASSSSPKTYEVSITPDTVVLGTNHELFIKVKNLKAIELSDPDGTIKGIKLTYDLDATNNNKIGGSSITLNPADFRVELDNGTKITNDNSFSAYISPEATATSAGNDVIIPKGAKPTALDLFFNDTRASLKMELK